MPDVRYLFGPVRLSSALPDGAHDWIVSYFRHYFAAPELQVRAQRRFEPNAAVSLAANACWARHSCPVDAMTVLQQRLAGLGTSLPVLFRQYVDLVDPEGVKFFDFSMYPSFGHCEDGLIRLDLTRLKRLKRARYLTPHAATKSTDQSRNLLVTIDG